MRGSSCVAAPNKIRPVYCRGCTDDPSVEDQLKGEHREPNHFFAGHFQNEGCLTPAVRTPGKTNQGLDGSATVFDFEECLTDESFASHRRVILSPWINPS